MMNRLRKLKYISLILFLVACIGVHTLYAQAVYRLSISHTSEAVPLLNYQKYFKDTLSLTGEWQHYLYRLQAKGYVTASLAGFAQDSSGISVRIDAGESYEWEHLSRGNLSDEIVRAVGFKEKQFINARLYAPDVELLFDKIIGYAENNGYPFASIGLTGLEIRRGKVSAEILFSSNQMIRIDSIRILGKQVVSKKYLMSYLNMKEGELYNEEKLRNISKLLRDLPFLTEAAPMQIYFNQDGAEVDIFLDKRNANQFDGLIGFQPDASRPGKTRFIGQAHLRLMNAFKRGELLDMEFKAQPDRTQDLKLRVNYPYLFATPFGVDAGLAIRKQDTTYLDALRDLGLVYYISGSDQLKIYVQQHNSSLLSVSAYEHATELPSFADVSTALYGMSLRSEHLDYRYNPRKGFTLQAGFAAGTRNIRKNASLNEALYDSLLLKTNQYKIDLKADYYYNLYRKNVVNLGVNAAKIIGTELFQNELYRFGGINDFRGFDEESIFASAFVIAKVEYRYLLEKNSYFSAFYNQAFYENKSRGKNLADQPYGFGAGVSFETKAGIFSLSYALGSQFGSAVNLQNGKIHFGIINYF